MDELPAGPSHLTSLATVRHLTISNLPTTVELRPACEQIDWFGRHEHRQLLAIDVVERGKTAGHGGWGIAPPRPVRRDTDFRLLGGSAIQKRFDQSEPLTN